MLKYSFHIFILFSFYSNTIAVDLSQINFSYLYDGTLNIRHQLTLKEDTFYVYISLKTKPNKVNLLYQNGYKDKNHHQILISDTSIINSGQDFIFQAKFKNISSYTLLVLELMQHGITYYYDIPINKSLMLGYPDFNLINAIDSSIIFESYLSINQDYSILGYQDSMACYSYRQNFPSVQPPMVTRLSPKNKTLLLDSVFMFRGKIKPDSIQQLLFFQSDSSSNIGRGYISVPEYFPKIRSFEELIRPLIYISTKDEFQQLNTAKDKKKAFDAFWISKVKNKERAKRVIKNYYKNVSHANIYFTTYKEGWKTDLGIIFIIFGKPIEVTRSENEEKWSYFLFGEKLTFNFEKLPNLFVRQQLRLVKDKKYSQIWYRQVSTWRKGNL